MAPRNLRTQVAVLGTTAGLAVLLAGPASTFGLGVPGTDTTVSQVTGTIQGAAQTTEQTVATAVPQVQSTVQTTVQTTTQAVAVPQPSAPAPASSPAPVQAVKKVAAAPRQAVARVTAPVKKPAATAVPAPRAGTQRLIATSRVSDRTASATRATRITVAKHAAVTRRKQQRDTAAPRSTGGADAPIPCELSLLSLLPGGSQLGALASLACDTVAGIDLPARVGLAPQSASGNPTSLGNVLGTISRVTSDPARSRLLLLGNRAAAGAAARPLAGAAQAGRPGSGGAFPLAREGGRSGAIAYVDAFRTANDSPAPAPAATTAADPSASHHHGWFSGQSRGTELLIAILFASLSVLGGITLWRLAVRWVIPRFA